VPVPRLSAIAISAQEATSNGGQKLFGLTKDGFDTPGLGP